MSKLLVHSTTTSAGNAILALDGAINAATVETLEAALDSAPSHSSRIILDFSAVKYVSSNGIGVLLNAAKKARTQHGKIIRLKPSATVLNALDLLNVLVMFPIANDAADTDKLFETEA